MTIAKLRARDLKVKVVEELVSLLGSYPVFAIADLTGIRAKQLQEIRKRFKDKFRIKVAKNTLVKLALSRLSSKLNHIDKTFPHLTGPNAFIFTNMNAFSLYALLEKNKIPSFAAPGDVAQSEIVVPAGNTGMTPGPILSKFSQLKIPTKIQEGSVWISKDTVVAKPGDVISPELADLLTRLGIKPIMVGLKVKIAYDNGLVIPAEQLAINLEDYRAKISEAYGMGLGLALSIAFITKETTPLLLHKAILQAESLALNANVLMPCVAPKLLTKAYAQALALALRISSIRPELAIREIRSTAVSQKPPAETKGTEKVEERKEVKEGRKEEETAEGAASLFG